MSKKIINEIAEQVKNEAIKLDGCDATTAVLAVVRAMCFASVVSNSLGKNFKEDKVSKLCDEVLNCIYDEVGDENIQS
ncbi:hypothetical protein LO80_03430 [Candidatus Francisella endociliophora]|uniref:Uncharacterized protein n=1 Tax=Candidatus Francisella endociliophora TaxID=653937 RepID=A0A097ENH0_9GAMM|nr:hypothetical protein [Francisella sp. FSC1006]AIT09110.1 hypothetical protein LO80_03430 [Francisella sp. FSC1006]